MIECVYSISILLNEMYDQFIREHLCDALMRGVWGGPCKLLVVNVARFCLHFVS